MEGVVREPTILKGGVSATALQDTFLRFLSYFNVTKRKRGHPMLTLPFGKQGDYNNHFVL